MSAEALFFEKLVEAYYGDIYKYAVFCLKDGDSAGDIAQDTFVLAYKNIDKLKAHENPGGFIFRTAQNLIKNHKKQLYKRIMREISLDGAQMDIGDDKNSIESALDSNINEYEYITDILDELDDEKKRLYKMYYVDNIPMKEIADRLGVEYTSLRMKYVRLRRDIRVLVKEYAEKYFVTY